MSHARVLTERLQETRPEFMRFLVRYVGQEQECADPNHMGRSGMVGTLVIRWDGRGVLSERGHARILLRRTHHVDHAERGKGDLAALLHSGEMWAVS